MFATVVWVGSIASISLLVLPTMKRSMQPAEQLAFLDALQKRLEPLAWFCLGTLIVTGLFQMSANVHYNGFLDTSTQWSLAIMAKYLLVIAMVIATAVQTWEVFPAIRRSLLRPEKFSDKQRSALQKRGERLLRINFILSILILGVTAIARTS